MRKILTGLLASAALLGLATSAFAMGDCGFGHTKQVMASTGEEEATTLSTYDGDVKLPESVSEADEPSVVVFPSEDERSAE